MAKKLGNILLLIGLSCLLIFFSSSHFLVDQGWFLIGGMGSTSLGLLIRRQGKTKKKYRRKMKRKEREKVDESD